MPVSLVFPTPLPPTLGKYYGKATRLKHNANCVCVKSSRKNALIKALHGLKLQMFEKNMRNSNSNNCTKTICGCCSKKMFAFLET